MYTFLKEGIVMRNWKKLFEPHILSRGKLYYLEDRVDDLNMNSGTYTAEVYGSEEYHVEVITSGDLIEDMSCTCPYARDRGNCKHMAAVLYAIEEDGVLPVQEDHLSPADLINSISESDLRSFVTELAQNNPAIYKELSLRYGNLTDRSQKQILLSEIEEITDEYAGYEDEISYEDAYSYALDLSTFIEERPITLLKSCGPEAVLEVAFHALEEYCFHDVDDSDGGTGLFEDAIACVLSSLLESSTKEQEKAVFSWLWEYRTAKGRHWITEEIIDSMLDSFFHGLDYAEAKLKIADEILQEAIDLDHSWKLETSLVKKYLLLRQISERKQEFEDFKNQYKQVSCIRRAEIQALIQENLLDKAIALLLESRLADADKPGLIREYTEQLIDIYMQQEKAAEQKEELLYYIRNFRQENLHFLLQLKELTDENEWIQCRTEYLNRRDEFQRLKLMEHEQLWDTLMDAVAEDNSLYTMQTYEKSLQPRFSDRFNGLYTDLLRIRAQACSNRKAYWSLMQDLKHLASYPGGSALALELASEWKNLYPRRSAMLDELKKAGF